MKDSTRHNLRDVLGIGGTAALILAVAIVLALTGWGISVLLAPLFGAGNVHRDVNNAQNQEHWSAQYQGSFNQLQADMTQIGVIRSSLAATHSVQDRTDLNGAQLNCVQDAANYNALTHNVLGAKWLPAGLPSDVDASHYCA